MRGPTIPASAVSTLDVAVRRRLGVATLEAAFTAQGRLTAIWGPSGSGKTTLVNLIGGLETPDSGRVCVDGRVLFDSETRVALPAHKRRIGYVFQDARLFPHLTVRQNLLYGRFFAPRDERYVTLDRVLALLGLEPLLERRPTRLSGGERQRVAIGRALLASPRLILMDEPLASLDDSRKAEILPFIEDLRDTIGVPIVYVSHALTEVVRLASDIVVMDALKLVAAGPLAPVMERLNLWPAGGRADGGALVEMVVERQDAAFGLTELRSRAGLWRLPRVEADVGATVRARVRARDVMLARVRPEGISALNVLAGTVSDIRADGAEALVTLDCNGDRVVARITSFSRGELALEVGVTAHAVVKAVTFDGAGVGRAPREASAAARDGLGEGSDQPDRRPTRGIAEPARES